MELKEKWIIAREKVEQYKSDKDTAYSLFDPASDTFYVVVNQTDHAREWMENVMFWTNNEYGIAYGYYNAGKELLPQVYEDWNGESPIEFIGSSRGGAISMYLALKFMEYDARVKVTTFGCPPVGNKYFRTVCENRSLQHTRVVMKGDRVTRIPFYRKHYQSELILLDHDLKGTKEIHQGYGQFL